MNYFKKTIKVKLATSESYTLIDDLHDTPFQNLTVWIRPMSNVTYTYSVDYGGKVQNSGSAIAGALTTYNDSQVFPPNQPNANWSEHSDGDYYVVGLPVNVIFTNTGVSAVFLCSILSETKSQVI